MSLINDALKRAKVEALRQEADRRGVDYQAVPAYSRARGSKSNFLVVGWIVAGVAVALVLALSLRGTQQPASAARPGAPVPVEHERAVVGTGGVGEEVASREEAGIDVSPGRPPSESASSAAAVPSEESSEAALAEAPAGPAAPTQQEPMDVSSEPAIDGQVQAPPPERRFRSTAQVNAPLVEGMTYLRRARAADGSTVELGGIAYSDDRPIAVINSSVVSDGDMIQGFTVISIEPERVQLETGGTRIYLALH